MDFGNMPGGLEGLLGGGGLAGLLGPGGLDGIWEMPMIQMIAFHPRPETATHMGATSGPVRDGTFNVGGGDSVSYRLYMPQGKDVELVVYNFHGNAEVCTDIGGVADRFHSVGAALLSIDYRGFAWGTGSAKLTTLCPDAEACWRSSQKVLDDAGCGKARRVVMGRSIGATCAVHLASRFAADVSGLIVDSGLMSIKQLPMVESLAPQVLGPQAAALFPALKEPFDTYGKLASVGCPTLIMHGEKDEIVPVAQAKQCEQRCASPGKRYVSWPTARHNDVAIMAGSAYMEEILGLLSKAQQFDNALPAGALVEAHSLSKPEFNGLKGRILGPQGDRFRVDLGSPHGEKALKPENLKVLERCAPEEEPPFALGATVEAHSLSAVDLNGLQGRVTGFAGDRVKVLFPEPHGEKSIKPANLKAV